MTLEFKRTTRFNLEKLSAKLRRDWLTVKPYKYRVTFRRQVFGVSVPAGYQATCLCNVPGNWEDGRTQTWCFVDRNRRLFKTLRKAIEACERHDKMWEKLCLCPSMRAIKTLFGGRQPQEVPVWMTGRINRTLLGQLMDHSPVRYSDEEIDEEHFEVDELPEPEPELEVEKKTRGKVALEDIEEAMGEPMPTVSPSSETPTISETPVKKRGRPKGSKNKKK